MILHVGSYGLPKPWYFPVTKSYWFGHPRTEAQQCSWRMCCDRDQVALSVMEEDQACALENSDGTAIAGIVINIQIFVCII